MKENHVTLLRVPLLHNCPFYQGEDPSIYFTMTESTFKKALNELPQTMEQKEKDWIIQELTSHPMDALQTEAELHAMHVIYELVPQNDVVNTEYVYPKEFDELYEQYVKTQPFVRDNQQREWFMQNTLQPLAKEDFLWHLYTEKYKRVS